MLSQLSFVPLTKDHWKQFEKLFGQKGACGNCWCMLYRLSNVEWEAGKKNGNNKKDMRNLVNRNAPTGVLAMHGDEAIGWCAFAPREDLPKLERSRVHKRIDDKPVWSIPCFFVKKEFRGKGVSVALLTGLINYAKRQKIKIIEAYPAIPTKGKLPDAFAWIGLYRSFEKAGFKIVDRTSVNRPMVRYEL